MEKKMFFRWVVLLFLLFSLLFEVKVFSQDTEMKQDLDQRVQSFLKSKQGTWRDMNVPESDGKLLYDLIIKNNYKSALEIGTSTGHSSIWIAWALSKTGGKLITIEIDKERYQEALANFTSAGLADSIDARFADAHELVKELTGPFDFVFCDADKDWYKNYFTDVYPKLQIGGCFTAHNVSESRWTWHREAGTVEFYNFVKNQAGMETTVDNHGNGMSISYKKSGK